MLGLQGGAVLFVAVLLFFSQACGCRLLLASVVNGVHTGPA
jgi:hypothetical protein